MAKTGFEARFQILLEQANKDDQKAKSELISIALRYLKGEGVPRHIEFGAGILELLAKRGDKNALNKLVEFAIQMLQEDPNAGFRYLKVSSGLGSLQAKRNLAVCFLYGIGTNGNVNKTIQLLKACYKEGDKSALEDISSLAAKLLAGEDRAVKQDLKKAVELFTFAAQEGHADAVNNRALPASLRDLEAFS